MTAKERFLEYLRIYRDDLPAFMANVLKIRTKSGSIEPLIMNKPQLHGHRLIEEQKAKTGKVRALWLKGRQEGVSTYIQGRKYKQTIFRRGIRTYILTHEQDATDNLFGMAKLFYKESPELLRPAIRASNKKELDFGDMESKYGIGTAGAKETGRSQTNQQFHGSEVAFWPNAVGHAAGALQAVPNEVGTEIILESTANGYDALFQPMWKKAVAGESEYIAIFTPWFWMDEYRTPLPQDFRLEDEEIKLKELHGLDDEQIMFRRVKIDELGSVEKFKQEYPCTAEEAFQLSGHESYIPSELVQEAAKRENAEGQILIVGVDPAESEDGDASAFAYRSAGHISKADTVKGRDPAQVAGLCVNIIQEHAREFNSKSPYEKVLLCIDGVGIGAGVVAILKEQGYSKYIARVGAGEKAIKSEDYNNKKAEMAGELLEWLEDGGDLPNDRAVLQDCVATGFDADSKGRLRMESKKDVRKRTGGSPDIFDAICLTFAVPVTLPKKRTASKPTARRDGWMG